MQEIRIVLVEPAGALNVGAIARVMKNMGLNQLILVNPKCDPLGEESRRMAVHAQDVLDHLKIVESLPVALQGCQRVIATTARSRSLPTKLETPRQVLPWLLEDNLPTAILFGPEDRGLSNQELNYGQRFVGIPSNPDYASLNLAQAVGICAYELYQAYLQPQIDKSTTYDNLQEEISLNIQNSFKSDNNASVDTLEAYYHHLESSLLDIGYLYPHTAQARMAKFRRIYNRAFLSPEDVSMLRGVLRQVDWAIKQNK